MSIKDSSAGKLMPMSGYKLRNFVDGDEKQIIELFNDVYREYCGYVPRTVDYWRWCCLKRPDVHKDGIFLVFDEETGSLEGYAVVGLSGNIWEFCSKPNREDVALLLLDKAIDYLKERGVTSVNVNVPETNKALNEACRKMGFARVDLQKMFVGMLSFSKLFSILAQDKKDFLCERFNEEICIVIKDAPFWIEKAVSIGINGDEVKVSESLLESPTIFVRTDVKTLSSILFGVQNPWRAILSFKVYVKPFWKIPRLINFFNSIRLSDSWFWPLSDFG